MMEILSIMTVAMSISLFWYYTIVLQDINFGGIEWRIHGISVLSLTTAYESTTAQKDFFKNLEVS